MFKLRLNEFINSLDFKHDMRKVGINLVTLGILGVLINFGPINFLLPMFWPGLGITLIGLGAIYYGATR